MVSVDVEALAAVNAVDGVTVFTVPDGLHVDAGRTLAGVKITPLAISEWSLEQAERARAVPPEGDAGIVSVRPFLPLRVAAIVRQQLTDDARTRFEQSLGMRSAWFGGSIEPVRYVDDSPDEVQQALIDAAGSRRHRPRRRSGLGRSARRHLAEPASPPARPRSGAAFRCTRAAATGSPSCSDEPVIGVASCGMFSRRSALDLLIARLHAGLPLDAAYLASLGHGGLLGKEAAWRIPPYEAALGDDTDED